MNSALDRDCVRKIAVLRPNAVGDFVFVLPALHALKQRYPDAEIVLLGKAWHASFLDGRPGPVDRVAVMPPVPGVGAPVDAACNAGAIEGFVEAMREEDFDIALQMFGAGHYSNPFVVRLGARLSAGARADGAPPLDRWVPYCEPNNRRLALLDIAALAGAPRLSLPPLPELAVTDVDRREAAAVLPFTVDDDVADGRLAVLQPGATDPRRCWPAQRFAALGDLCGLLERAALVVSNDTGPLHLALALGVPSVGIFWLTNLIEGTPLRQSHLRAALSLRTRCPVCGQDNIARRCRHVESFVADVSLEQVERLALSLL